MKKLNTNKIVKIALGALLSVLMLSTTACPSKDKKNKRGGTIGYGPGISNCTTNCQGIPAQSNSLGMYIANNTQYGVQFAMELFSGTSTTGNLSGQSGVFAKGAVFVLGNVPCDPYSGPDIVPGVYGIINILRPGMLDPYTGTISGLVIEVGNGANKMVVEISHIARLALTGGEFLSCDGVPRFHEMSISTYFTDNIMNGIPGKCNNGVYADMAQGGLCQNQ